MHTTETVESREKIMFSAHILDYKNRISIITQNIKKKLLINTTVMQVQISLFTDLPICRNKAAHGELLVCFHFSSVTNQNLISLQLKDRRLICCTRILFYCAVLKMETIGALMIINASTQCSTTVPLCLKQSSYDIVKTMQNNKHQLATKTNISLVHLI